LSDPQIESIAFRHALLKSERLRIYIVLATVATAFLLRTGRSVIVGGNDNLSEWLVASVLLAGLAAFELIIVVRRKSRNSERSRGSKCGLAYQYYFGDFFPRFICRVSTWCSYRSCVSAAGESGRSRFLPVHYPFHASFESETLQTLRIFGGH